MSRFHSCLSLGYAVTGVSRGAFDPDARRTHLHRAARSALAADGAPLLSARDTVTLSASSHTFHITLPVYQQYEGKSSDRHSFCGLRVLADQRFRHVERRFVPVQPQRQVRC